jgi:hypothetical protein
MARRVVALVGGLLVLFHLWLFLDRLWQGQLADPGALLRWAMAGGLTAALWTLHRRGVSLVRGRKAVAIWVLAALLHAPAMAGEHPADHSPALAEVVTTVAQLIGSVRFGLGLILLAVVLHRQTLPRLARARALSRPRGRPLDRGRSLHFSPRPPPLLPTIA